MTEQEKDFQDNKEKYLKPTVMGGPMTYLAEKMLKGRKDSLSETALASLGWGSLTGGSAYLLNRLIKNPHILQDSLKASIAGAAIPIVVNGMTFLINRKDADRQDSKDLINAYFNKMDDVSDSLDKEFKKNQIEKQAGIASVLWKGNKSAAKFLWKNIKPIPKNAPLGEKIMGLATKGGLLTGAYYAGKNLGTPRYGSQRNYTTRLRNNILAKNLHMSELSEADQQAVLELGMK